MLSKTTIIIGVMALVIWTLGLFLHRIYNFTEKQSGQFVSSKWLSYLFGLRSSDKIYLLPAGIQFLAMLHIIIELFAASVGWSALSFTNILALPVSVSLVPFIEIFRHFTNFNKKQKRDLVVVGIFLVIGVLLVITF